MHVIVIIQKASVFEVTDDNGELLEAWVESEYQKH